MGAASGTTRGSVSSRVSFFEHTGKDEVAALEQEQAGLGPRIEELLAK